MARVRVRVGQPAQRPGECRAFRESCLSEGARAGERYNANEPYREEGPCESIGSRLFL